MAPLNGADRAEVGNELEAGNLTFPRGVAILSKFDTRNISAGGGPMTGRNISLTDRLASFIDAQVRVGRHQNASEVVREALRRYEDDIEAQEASTAAIRAAADEGMAAIARGDFVVVRGRTGSQDLFKPAAKQDCIE
jgi:antitoxin ParD1/3/4